jgi:toxin CcdB
MPNQLSVHCNPGRNKTVVPFVVVVQSNRFRTFARRVVVPLVAAGAFQAPDSDVGPHFVVEDQEVTLDPLQITNVPCSALGPPVGSLVAAEDRVLGALDTLLSRAWQ